MKNLFYLVLSLVTCSAMAQAPFSIAHFQKKASVNELILPGDLYNSSFLLVTLPDSTYDSGTVQIKKLKCKETKLKSYGYNFSNDSIGDVIFSVKGKRRFNELKALLSAYLDSIPELTKDKVSSKVIKKSDSNELFFEFVRIRNSFFFSIKQLNE